MKTNHTIIIGNSNKTNIKNDSVNLVLTSPPYPMIKMWDYQFSIQSEEVRAAIEEKDGILVLKKCMRD